MVAGAGKDTIEDLLGQAALRLPRKGFLEPNDIVSQRIPERDAFVSVSLPSPEAPMAFRWTSLSDTPSDLHHRIYASRPDVGAIASGSFKWTGALARLEMSLPAVFDEQVRHLGGEVRRLATGPAVEQPITALANGANAYALDDMSLCFGMGLERLLLNIEILEKSAQSFVLAHCAAQQVRRIPWLVEFIANRRLKKDQKNAATRHLRGERSVMKASY